MIPRTVKVMERPITKTPEKASELTIPLLSLFPAVKPIIRGIITSTQGLEAVRIP
ncbi:unnamed protein product, partial [marine sediment metagenome]